MSKYNSSTVISSVLCYETCKNGLNLKTITNWYWFSINNNRFPRLFLFIPYLLEISHNFNNTPLLPFLTTHFLFCTVFQESKGHTSIVKGLNYLSYIILNHTMRNYASSHIIINETSAQGFSTLALMTFLVGCFCVGGTVLYIVGSTVVPWSLPTRHQ